MANRPTLLIFTPRIPLRSARILSSSDHRRVPGYANHLTSSAKRKAAFGHPLTIAILQVCRGFWKRIPPILF